MLELIEEFNLLEAFWMTIKLALWSGFFALIIGTFVAILRVSPVGILNFLGTAYVNIFRNTPLTLVVVACSLVLWGQLGIEPASRDSATFIADLNFRLGVIGLAVYHAAFVCESIRSGVNTVPIGQAEAARAIGLPFLPAARLIILPQAFRGAIAPLGNTLIALLKNSTVAAAASVTTETSSLMKTMIEFNSNYIYGIFLTFAIGYVILVIPIGLLTTSLSTRLAVRR